LREGIVGDNQIRFAPFQYRQKLRTRQHLGDGASHPACLQGGLNQRRIQRIILQMQNMQGACHSTAFAGAGGRAAGGFCATRGGGSLTAAQNTPKLFTAFMKSTKSTGFTTIGVHAQLIALHQIRLFAGRGEHDNGDRL